MTLRTYVIRRLLLLIPTFFISSILIFALIYLAPGDPVQLMFGARPVPPEIREEITRRLGLDQPLPIQYLIWVSKLLQGDLGYSYISHLPVIELIGNRIPRTVELMLVANFLSLAVAVALGVIAAVKEYSLTDAVTSGGALIGYSTPSFWLALMALMLFSVMLGWFPLSGLQSPGEFATPFHALLDHLWHLVLPASVLTFGWTAYLFRLVRSSMLEVLRQDYIITARAKGLRERVVIYKHALRNALIPVVTYEGYAMGFLLGGAVIIEQIFSWLGLGHFMVFVALVRDYPVLMGLSMFIVVMVLIGNLCADIAYALVDPRIGYD